MYGMEAFFTRHTRLFSSFVLPGRSHAVLSVFFDYGIPPHGVTLARFSCCSSSGKAGCCEYGKAPPELLRRGFALVHKVNPRLCGGQKKSYGEGKSRQEKVSELK